MTATREAIVLPGLFLTVALLGGLRVADRVALLPPPLFALVLSVLLLGVLVRSGVVAPDRLVHTSRPALANVNGAIVLIATFLASAQAFNAVTPDSGLPRLLFNVFFLVLLANTLAAAADRIHVLRSLLVVFGSAFVLKFVVLAAVSGPAEGFVSRAIQLLFEGMTLGSVTQQALHPATGYVAFFTLLLYLAGLTMLPAALYSSKGDHDGRHRYPELRTPAARDLVDP